MAVRRSKKLKDRPFERVTRLLYRPISTAVQGWVIPLTVKNLSQSLCGVSEEFACWCVYTLDMYGKHRLRRMFAGESPSPR